MRLHLKEPESLKSQANGTKSPRALAAGPVFKGYRWNPKWVFEIQPSFATRVDLGSLKELSLEERPRWGCCHGPCSAARAPG